MKSKTLDNEIIRQVTILYTIIENPEFRYLAFEIEPEMVHPSLKKIISLLRNNTTVDSDTIWWEIANKYTNGLELVKFISDNAMRISPSALPEIVDDFVREKKLILTKEKLRVLLETANDPNDFAINVLKEINTMFKAKTNAITLDKVGEEVLEKLEKQVSNKELNHFLDLPYVDDILPPLIGGELIVLAARPSVGKSAVMLNMAYELASKKIPSVYFSLEMNAEQQYIRIWQRFFNFSLRHHLRHLTTEQLHQFKEVNDKIKEIVKYIYIIDTTYGALSEIVANIIKLASKGIKIFFIDYLQLIKVKQRQARYLEIATITHTLKELALEYNISIIAAAQLGRSVEQREDKKPRFSDLRESGDIESDADAIIMLYNPLETTGDEKETIQLYLSEDNQDIKPIAFYVAKNRNGITGTNNWIFDKKHLIINEKINL